MERMIWILVNNLRDNDEVDLISSELTSRGLHYKIVLLGMVTSITIQGQTEFYYESVKIEPPDVCLIRIGAIGPSHWYLLSIVRALQSRGVRCINPADTIDVLGGKHKISLTLSEYGVAIPRFFIYTSVRDIPIVLENFKFPVILKTFYGSFGEGVHLCQTPEEFVTLTKFLSNVVNAGYVVQEYIGHCVGQDIRLLIINNRISGAMRRISPSSYKANLTDSDAYAVHQEITPELVELAESITAHIDLRMVSIDVLQDQDSYRVCEINLNTGFKYYNNFCNRSLERDIVDYIETLI